ncbi:dual specificity protein phosphatase 16-like [Xiphophorus maculatus]|uniref:dual specificity protein phosphatase 16-like n=1 Tax=Xiphophorus maculatus TaxID=8083 RepID=UPI0003B58F08|nr:dual specificity protein phosphatase 16-like [Xiphophorus maculatus]
MVWSRDAEAERPQLSVILPRLYLGAERDVTQDQLASLGISYVLSVSRCSPQPSFLPRSRFLRIPIDDSLWDDLLPWIPQALSFIDSAMSSGASVLVHCAAGISRSPALAVAYIMYSLEMDLDHAYRFVKERRPSISPNFNFLGQLQHFQGILDQKASSCDMTRQQQENQQPSTENGGAGLLRSQNRNHCVNTATEDSIIQTRKSLLDDSGNKRGPWTFDLTACQNQRCNQKLCDAPASSLCESRDPLPKCRQLQFPSGCTSVLEKRKSLTLSLTPLGFCPPSSVSSRPQSVVKVSPVHGDPHPQRSPRLSGCSRAEEKEQDLLSPSGITLNKLLDWGERVLLGLVHPVKMGQPALPYRC